MSMLLPKNTSTRSAARLIRLVMSARGYDIRELAARRKWSIRQCVGVVVMCGIWRSNNLPDVLDEGIARASVYDDEIDRVALLMSHAKVNGITRISWLDGFAERMGVSI